jgi:hypothetical protein
LPEKIPHILVTKAIFRGPLFSAGFFALRLLIKINLLQGKDLLYCVEKVTVLQSIISGKANMGRESR